MTRKVSAILAAGGSSSRMGENKLTLKIGGRSVFERSLALLQRNELVDEIVVVAAPDFVGEATALAKSGGADKVRAVVAGGANRFLSVQNGVSACSPDAGYYCIHDAARPFASDALVSAVIEAALKHGAAAPCLPLIDTVKQCASGYIETTLDRDALCGVATPQVFESALYRRAAANKTDAFDDCQLIEEAGGKVFMVPGERDNIKITTPEDVARAREIAGELLPRAGTGYDVHRLAEGRKFILGGVEIEYEKGLLGHSDADVLTHAVIDALLGAAALGDIGSHFPDADARYKNANSLALLREVAALVRDAGYVVGNVDATVICQAPKLAPFIREMRGNLADALGADVSRVSVKATTEERLGFTGSGDGVAAQCVAVLAPKTR